MQRVYNIGLAFNLSATAGSVPETRIVPLKQPSSSSSSSSVVKTPLANLSPPLQAVAYKLLTDCLLTQPNTPPASPTKNTPSTTATATQSSSSSSTPIPAVNA